MAVPTKHVLSQLPALCTLGGAALSAILPRRSGTAPKTPGPWIDAELSPRPAGLVRDYIRHVGGDPAWYRGRMPAHFFSQWGFPLAARALSGLPYPLARVVNAGCRIEQHAPLPVGEPLFARARLQSIDEDERRALVTTRVETGTRDVPFSVIAEMRVFIPLPSRGEGKKSGGNKAKPTVPADAREIAFMRLSKDAGLDFAKLTGDFNPIHWIRPYARASGFRSTILHGFATLARAIEALNRARFAGDPARLRIVDARFTRPLVLPGRAGVYVDDAGGIWVGDAPAGGAYLEGHYETEASR
ncbi:MaoC/PaaZ C-terminal domain-containing protein [Polyangium aurulentum]|uniref:MaoC/PaaZ C-terminal domain-containing protein n=1 Tax=Polyangium aurulentum TaxID=2567896 RepID=UPI0010AED1AF|nr:MaoC/PaaZ C-terminal domain-containing protein [Polyangium aurulentum]UQA59466.1 hypothetical protein E8A73_002855 [Polyangium aurulentum]